MLTVPAGTLPLEALQHIAGARDVQMFVQLIQQLAVQLLPLVLEVLPQVVQPFHVLQRTLGGLDRRHQQLRRVQVVLLGHEGRQLLGSFAQFVHLIEHLQHVLVLDGVRVQLLEFLPPTAQQLLARLQVLLDHVDPLARAGDLGGNLPEQLHNPREVAIVLRHELVQPLVGLAELLLDLELLALTLLVRFARIEGFDDRNQQPAATLLENGGISIVSADVYKVYAIPVMSVTELHQLYQG